MADETLMRLIDAYADATFDQALHQRTEDDAPESKRQAIVKYLAATQAPADPVCQSCGDPDAPWSAKRLDGTQDKFCDECRPGDAMKLAAAPAPAPAPLTREQVQEIVREAGYHQNHHGGGIQARVDFINGIRHGERAHGIGASTEENGNG